MQSNKRNFYFHCRDTAYLLIAKSVKNKKMQVISKYKIMDMQTFGKIFVAELEFPKVFSKFLILFPREGYLPTKLMKKSEKVFF